VSAFVGELGRSLPDGWGTANTMIRLALPSDVPGIAAVHVRTWRVAYRGHLPDAFLDAMDPSQRASWWSGVVVDPNVTVLVSVEAESVVGFCSFLPSRDEDAPPSTCELVTLYLDPSHWRAGIGRALLESAIDDVSTRGFLSATGNHGVTPSFVAFAAPSVTPRSRLARRSR
jgi:L-amino acid N-acyltransferase YncA